MRFFFGFTQNFLTGRNLGTQIYKKELHCRFDLYNALFYIDRCVSIMGGYEEESDRRRQDGMGPVLVICTLLKEAPNYYKYKTNISEIKKKKYIYTNQSKVFSYHLYDKSTWGDADEIWITRRDGGAAHSDRSGV